MLKLHDLYGQSFAHEFQFSNPDSIRNAVKRYNMQRAAERDDIRKERDAHRLAKPRFCKMRNTGRDVLSMVTSRDVDVETQISLHKLSDTPPTDSDDGDADDQPGWLQLTPAAAAAAVAAEEKWPVVRLEGGADALNPSTPAHGHKSRRSKRARSRKAKRTVPQPLLPDPDTYAEQIEGLHREVCAELQSMGRAQPELLRAAELAEQQTFWHRHRAPPATRQPPGAASARSSVRPALPKRNQQQKRKPGASVQSESNATVGLRLQQEMMTPQSYDRYQKLLPAGWANQLPSVAMPASGIPSEALTFNTQILERATQESEPPEDSDLEQEYADRPGYMRFVERLPYHFSDPDAGDQQGNGNEQNACFVELEPHPHWTRLQRSVKPMHYTSQRSDSDSSTLCDPPEQTPACNGESSTNVTLVNSSVRAAPSPRRQQRERERERKREREQRPGKAKARALPRAQPSKQRQQQQRQQHQELMAAAKAQMQALAHAQNAVRQQAGNEKEPPPSQPQLQLDPAEQPQPQPRRRRVRPVVCTRSLEKLKYQKTSIYSKISFTQERIISALDKLQCSLLQLSLVKKKSSGNSHGNNVNQHSHEKRRRERNAFNFCVRFSRNYLYPLRGMIEDVRSTPVASFNSATSNEASQRVVCVYGLMYHSIGRYQRQVRYFLLEKVPQKLSALIEMMYTLTNVCLEKGVLDRQDPVVECLQQRCTSFLTFIEDMQEQRFQLARETFMRLQRRAHGSAVHHGPSTNRPHGMHDRYDLKMFLNDLKLYEPRLVPKERTEKRRGGQRVWLRKPKLTDSAMPGGGGGGGGGGVIMAQPSDLEQETIADDVPTHIECVQCGDNRGEPTSEPDEVCDQRRQLSNVLTLLGQPGLEKRHLHQQLLEALEHETKSQVRDVIDPLVRTLGVILSRKMTAEAR